MIVNLLDDMMVGNLRQMASGYLHFDYDIEADRYTQAHNRWLRYAGGEAQCAFEGAVTALLKPGDRILDAACGTGSVARRLLAEATGTIDLVLLDASARMLAQCQNIHATRITGCMTDIPFQDGHFDLVTCAWGIEVLEDPRPALQEFVRVTRRGGHICLVFCADRPAQSVLSSVLRRQVSRSRRGQFLDHAVVKTIAVAVGAHHVQALHCSGPAAAVIVHV